MACFAVEIDGHLVTCSVHGPSAPAIVKLLEGSEKGRLVELFSEVAKKAAPSLEGVGKEGEPPVKAESEAPDAKRDCVPPTHEWVDVGASSACAAGSPSSSSRPLAAPVLPCCEDSGDETHWFERLERARVAGRAAARKLSGARRSVPPTPAPEWLPANRYYAVLRPKEGGEKGIFEGYREARLQVERSAGGLSPRCVFHGWPTFEEAQEYACAAGVDVSKW